MAALGINLSSTTNENIKIENNGNEIPLYRSGTGSFKAGDYILFYGEPFKSLYTKKNVYWLYQGASNGKRMTVKDGSQYDGYPVQATFNIRYRGEEDKKYWETIPNGEGVDHWFWERLQPTETTAAAASFIVPLNNIVTTGGNFSMKVNLRAETSLAHQTRVYVNNVMVKDFTWSGQVERTEDIVDIAPTLFVNGNNTIKIEESLATGTSVEVADLVESEIGEPSYIDGFGRIEYAFSPDTRGSLHVLLSSDQAEVLKADETEYADVEYRNSYVWGTLEHDFSAALGGRAILSYTDVAADRTGEVSEGGSAWAQWTTSATTTCSG